MKFKLTLLSFFILSNSNAQSLRVGLEAGGSVALGKISYTGFYANINNTTATGLRYWGRIGLPIQYQLGKSSAVHSGIFYTRKGLERNEHAVLTSLGLFYNAIELPLALVYTKNKQETNNFFIGGGGYISYALNGKIQSAVPNGQETMKIVSFGNTVLNNDMRRLDYGLHFQTGVTFQNGLLLRFVAQRQLNDMAIKNNGFGLNEIKNQAYIAITMAYLL